MNKDQREIERKLRILRYAEEIGHVAKACRYFGIGRSYKPYQKRSADPVKKDWSASAPKEVAKPKSQPTRTATVSTAVPSPAPKGEVPRVNAKAQIVPVPRIGAKRRLNPPKKALMVHHLPRRIGAKLMPPNPRPFPSPKTGARKPINPKPRKKPHALQRIWGGCGRVSRFEIGFVCC